MEHFEGKGTLKVVLVAFKMQGFKQQKTAFHCMFMKKLSKSFGLLVLLSFYSHVIVRVQAIEDHRNRFIVRVQTCGPSRDRRPWVET